jgi:uncharacterized protein with HXXEE motif
MIDGFTFRQAVWLFPPAFILHVVEEWPRFTRWAQTHASEQFTQHDYNAIHVAGIFASVLGATLVWLFPNRAVVLLFLTFLLAPSVCFNALFHAGASLLTRTYCPGVVTAILIYLPLFILLTERVYTERLLTPFALAASLLVAGLFHTWEVGHNVFKAW